ncbi:MAG TPA: hypothetical protein VHK69_14000 [Chitinophagaceae bacterium]|jgi:hypothetical protein|nr:hypothetical protein [Chitinophagaceae bacterium]
MTEETMDRHQLQEKLQALKGVLTQRQWMYFHLEAIGNFIYHLPSFSSDRTQARLSRHIHDYLELVDKRHSEAPDLLLLARELTPHMWRIMGDYRQELNFVGKPFYPFHLAVWTVLFFVFRSAFPAPIALAAVGVIALGTIIYYRLKIRAREYY